MKKWLVSLMAVVGLLGAGAANAQSSCVRHHHHHHHCMPPHHRHHYPAQPTHQEK